MPLLAHGAYTRTRMVREDERFTRAKLWQLIRQLTCTRMVAAAVDVRALRMDVPGMRIAARARSVRGVFMAVDETSFCQRRAAPLRTRRPWE